MRENVSANSARLIPEAIASSRVTDRLRDGRLEIFPRGSWKTHQVAASVIFPAILSSATSQRNVSLLAGELGSIYFCLNRHRIENLYSGQKRTEFRHREITWLPNDSEIRKTNDCRKLTLYDIGFLPN